MPSVGRLRCQGRLFIQVRSCSLSTRCSPGDEMLSCGTDVERFSSPFFHSRPSPDILPTVVPLLFLFLLYVSLFFCFYSSSSPFYLVPCLEFHPLPLLLPPCLHLFIFPSFLQSSVPQFSLTVSFFLSFLCLYPLALLSTSSCKHLIPGFDISLEPHFTRRIFSSHVYHNDKPESDSRQCVKKCSCC